MRKIIALVLMLACMFCMISCEALSKFNVFANNSQEQEDECSVTKEEWKAALSFTVPVTRMTQHLYWSSDINLFIYYSVTEFADNIVHEYYTNSTFTEIKSNEYRVKDGDSCVSYILNDKTGKWVMSTGPLSNYTNMFDNLNGCDNKYGIEEMLPYENFVYDNTERAYKCDSLTIEGQTYFDLVLKFKDGKLESYCMKSNAYGESMTINTNLSYEKVDIILPNVEE